MVLYPELRRLVKESEDPFDLATRLALAGNTIDAGSVPELNEGIVLDAVELALASVVEKDSIEALRQTAAQAHTILYLADNAGEIVFDRVLIELMGPDKTTVAVRSKPILNDASWDDAVAAGLLDMVKVVDNGSDVPGTLLDEAPRAFRRLVEHADLVIAKGQGNYETLTDVDRLVFFLLRANCPVIAANIGCERGALVIHRTALRRGERCLQVV
jgi:uncharacterized protein with ATP-grasp and redox domains